MAYLEELHSRRRRQVKALLIRGYHLNQMREKIDGSAWSKRTIERDIKAIRAESRNKNDDTKDKELNDFLMKNSELEKQLWKCFDLAESPSDKSRLAAQLTKIMMSRISVLQDIGVIAINKGAEEFDEKKSFIALVMAVEERRKKEIAEGKRDEHGRRITT